MTNLLDQLDEALKSAESYINVIKDTSAGGYYAKELMTDEKVRVMECFYPHMAKLLRVVRAADETYRDLIDFIKVTNQFTENTGEDIVIDENWPHWRLGQTLQALDEPK